MDPTLAINMHAHCDVLKAISVNHCYQFLTTIPGTGHTAVVVLVAP
jgi:hypothetical protein